MTVGMKTYRDGVYEIQEETKSIYSGTVYVTLPNKTEKVRLDPERRGGYTVYAREDKDVPWRKIGYRNNKERAIKLGKEQLYSMACL